jgi:hypothetical protein
MNSISRVSRYLSRIRFSQRRFFKNSNRFPPRQSGFESFDQKYPDHQDQNSNYEFENFAERDSYDEIPDHAEFEHENDDFEGNAEKRKKIAYLKKNRQKSSPGRTANSLLE